MRGVPSCTHDSGWEFQMRIIVGFVLGCCLSCVPVWAQAISTSQIKGTVQDPSGSVVPGAEVTVTQTDTSVARTVTTGADGGYLFTELAVGPYQLQVVKQGFSKSVQSGIV